MRNPLKTSAWWPILLLGSAIFLNAEESIVQPNIASELALEACCAPQFGDNVVFQQNMPIPVWGGSRPGAEVTVTFDRQKKSAVAGKDGAWRVVLDALPADKLTSVNQAPEGKTLTNFSFYFVQIASIGESPTDQPAGGDGRAEMRKAQLEALSTSNTGLAFHHLRVLSKPDSKTRR